MGISIGLVGLGAFGSEFADLFKSHPLVDRIALCDMEPERIARFAKKESWRDKFNERDAYDSLDAICASDLDALVIITQHWLHAPQCVQAMESGKHVYSAVPVITIPDSDEILEWCDRLVRTHERTGMRYMLGETTYFRPEAMYCRRKAAEGSFGNFLFAEAQYFHDVEHGLRGVKQHRLVGKAGLEWIEKSADYQRRGILSGPMHYPTHSTSGPVCVMNARALKVNCHGTPVPSGDSYFDDTAFGNETALFRMSNNATVRICEFRNCAFAGTESFSIYGTKGCYLKKNGHKSEDTWQDLWSEKSLSVAEMRDPLPPEVVEAFRRSGRGDDFYGGHGGSHAYLVHEFVDAIANDRQPAINVYEAAHYMAMGAVAHKSALRDGETLDVPDWGRAM
ncbi:MAG TPA: Gfo/Idh/MocA family oxidoreductase [Candidatus Brocadiia bacterium]|nr:Gfo/Idh/MocA family oxidoreductase [Candidatus Brocadiia bacterium]